MTTSLEVDASTQRALDGHPWIRGVLRRPGGVFGLVVMVIVLVSAALSLVWTPHPLLQIDPAGGWQKPSLSHILGTDQIGRDTFSWLLAGSRTTVIVVVGTTLLAGLIGIALGAISASLRPRYADPVIVLIDILVAFPVLLIAMLLATPFGGSLSIVVTAVGVGAGVNLARVLRSEIVRANSSDYILAARASGSTAFSRLVNHVLPNVAPVAVVQLSVTAGIAILAEAGLTFLGYGAAADEPSWGRVLSEAQKYIGIAPASVVWPGLAIGITVLALNLFGDALAEALDPRLVGEASDGD